MLFYDDLLNNFDDDSEDLDQELSAFIHNHQQSKNLKNT